jgi:hypothetical protein
MSAPSCGLESLNYFRADMGRKAKCTRQIVPAPFFVPTSVAGTECFNLLRELWLMTEDDYTVRQWFQL